MRVMLHGAINMSNYGDYLFAELFGHALKKNGAEVVYYAHPKYGISDYFAKYLGVTPDRAGYKRAMEKSDALVFISGGYFVEPLRKTLFSEYRHIRRYMDPAAYFMKAGKPIYISGVGAGPFENAAFSKKAKKVIEYASAVTVRNEESKKYCEDYGINKDVTVTADTALLIKEYMDAEKKDVAGFETGDGEKMLLFHIDGNPQVKSRLKDTAAPAVREFLKKHPEYRLYLAADGVKDRALYDEFAAVFAGCEPVILEYDDPWVFTRQIERADLIVTTKLHVGIVGSSFGCSVVSFPYVSNKTKRFYKQIGEEKRCVSLSEAGFGDVLGALEEYKDKKIVIPDELKEKARMNLKILPR